ncbi:MAG: hypothetical protein L0F91_03890 [Lactococcus lactis]|nr:hypothetical protein [Lactococcus lactis]
MVVLTLFSVLASMLAVL